MKLRCKFQVWMSGRSLIQKEGLNFKKWFHRFLSDRTWVVESLSRFTREIRRYFCIRYFFISWFQILICSIIEMYWKLWMFTRLEFRIRLKTGKVSLSKKNTTWIRDKESQNENDVYVCLISQPQFFYIFINSNFNGRLVETFTIMSGVMQAITAEKKREGGTESLMNFN